MNPLTPQCRNLYKSLYSVDYIPHSIKSKSFRTLIPVSEDPLIIDGHCANNLNINNKPLPKVLTNHPTIKPANEKYYGFVDTIENRSKVLYERFFKDTNIDREYIENEITNINKTEYQLKYSTNEFLPLNEYVRLCRRNLQKPDKLKFHDTTYLNSYNRILEYGDLREVLRSEDFRELGRRPVADELNRLYKTGKTTYQVSYPGEQLDPVKCKDR